MSLSPNTATVAAIRPPASGVDAVPSAATTFTSSPTQLLIADGVIVSATDQAGPVCSSEIGGHIRPSRPPSRTRSSGS